MHRPGSVVCRGQQEDMFGRIWRLFGGKFAMVVWRLAAAKKVGRNQDPKKVFSFPLERKRIRRKFKNKKEKNK